MSDQQTPSCALNEAMTDLKLASATIVTRNEEAVIEVWAGKITVIPAWKFLLSLADGADQEFTNTP